MPNILLSHSKIFRALPLDKKLKVSQLYRIFQRIEILTIMPVIMGFVGILVYSLAFFNGWIVIFNFQDLWPQILEFLSGLLIFYLAVLLVFKLLICDVFRRRHINNLNQIILDDPSTLDTIWLIKIIDPDMCGVVDNFIP